MASSSRVEIYARFLSAARTFADRASAHDALTQLPAALANLREAAIYVELISSQLDEPREALLKAAEDLDRVIGHGAGRGRLEEAIETYLQAITVLRDALREDLRAGVRDEPEHDELPPTAPGSPAEGRA